MPKLIANYPATLTLRVDEELKQELIALSYVIWNAGSGEYSKLARAFLEGGINKQKESLTPKQMEEFTKIFENLKFQEEEKRNKILGEETKKEEKENGTEPIE